MILPRMAASRTLLINPATRPIRARRRYLDRDGAPGR